MPWYAYLIIGFSVAMLAYILWTQRLASQMKGEAIEDLPGSLRDHDTQAPLVIYAHSPNCGPCKAITPRIDAMIDAGLAIAKLDVSKEPDAARQLNIRATPTFILIRNGRIEDIRLGAQNPARLEQFLAA